MLGFWGNFKAGKPVIQREAPRAQEAREMISRVKQQESVFDKARKNHVIYLSGPMAGLPESNFPEFHRLAKIWRDAGYVISSPAENFGQSRILDRNQYLKTDYINLVTQCHSIALMPGWENSVGARTELAIAQSLGYRVYDALTPGMRIYGLGDVAPNPSDRIKESVDMIEDEDIGHPESNHTFTESNGEEYEGVCDVDGCPVCKVPMTKLEKQTEVMDKQREAIIKAFQPYGQAEQPSAELKAFQSVCQIADQLVSVERQASYGNPKDDFARTTGMASKLGFRFMDPKTGLRELEPQDHAIYLLLTKISREVHSHKRDNAVDGCGYWKTLDQLYDCKG